MGYWKTHSEHGPAPYDDTWTQLANGTDTPCFETELIWHQVFWTQPEGSPYFILAHQYQAAVLNILAGVDGSVLMDLTVIDAEDPLKPETFTWEDVLE